jgi:hypothetical protein
MMKSGAVVEHVQNRRRAAPIDQHMREITHTTLSTPEPTLAV